MTRIRFGPQRIVRGSLGSHPNPVLRLPLH